MIDSSGRRALRANGTVLDMLPVSHVVLTGGILLVLLFTWIKPEASNGLSVPGRLLFWILHVGLGLFALWVATRWLANGALLPGNVLIAVFVSGCAGVVIAAPGYLALDALYEPYLVDMDASAPPGALPIAILKELLELAPWFLSCWLLINLPVLLPRPQPPGNLDDYVEHEVAVSSQFESQDERRADVDMSAASINQAEGESDLDSQSLESRLPLANPDSVVDRARLTTPQVDRRGHRFLSSLPGIVGTDVIAVSSDLHYLNVWTVAGRTTVLGKLRDVVNELQEEGMQIHRSHWVAHAHVRRITGNATSAACILSNQLRVPISRRRWSDVRNQYGRGVVHTQVD